MMVNIIVRLVLLQYQYTYSKTAGVEVGTAV